MTEIQRQITEQIKSEKLLIKDRKELSLELVTQVLNINLGYNKALMDNCETLYGYAIFVDLVRRYQKTEDSLNTAVTKAVNECIANGILAVKNLIEACQEFDVSKDDIIQKIIQKYSFSEEEAQKYVLQYWKINA